MIVTTKEVAFVHYMFPLETLKMCQPVEPTIFLAREESLS